MPVVMIRRFLGPILRVGLAVAAMLGSAPVLAHQVETCWQNRDPVQKVDACTGLIEGLDGEIGENAWALPQRANGHCWLGHTDLAVVDIWRWFDEDRTAIMRMQGKLTALGHFAAEIDGGYSAELDDAVIAWAEAGCPESR